MSVNRFLSKRGKNHTSSSNSQSSVASAVDPSSAEDFYGLFVDTSKPSSAEEKKIKDIRQRIVSSKSVLLKDQQILWALKSTFSKGDADAAHDLLLSLSNASEGIVVPYSANTRMLGAVNRQAVTCYLDSTLFAMFSRLDSFEAMLYNSFNDVPRNKLAFLLRLWVNLLRTGKLITTDITAYIQDALAECGWKDAANLRQQDASEAFTFITEVLKLPLLTLKMDMFHAGKQDVDDHRFINERLLEVAIPTDESGTAKEIKLEDCLEDYFNNRIEVRRFLERRSTMGSMRSFDSASKSSAVHVETIELDGDASPLTPLSPVPTYMNSSRPSIRTRAPSIIQERFVPEKAEEENQTSSDTKGSITQTRKGSVRKEVLMPAWQFFSLIPWYTDNAPSSDAQVAAHFSSKRPILGLCLKRYSMLPTGQTVRLSTYVDIPVEIGLPHFIQDDRMDDSAPAFGNFKLSLQSIVCHRGTSVDSGHYVSLVRIVGRRGSEVNSDHFMLFDDLAGEKVTTIDIQQALRKETPYLLFYQIMPIEGDPGNLTAGEHLPLYEISPMESGASQLTASPDHRLSITPSEPTSGRPSLDLPAADEFRGRGPVEARRPSTISFSDHLPVRDSTKENHTDSNRRKSASLSRTTSVLSKTFSNLAGAKPKDQEQEAPTQESDIPIKVTSTGNNEASQIQNEPKPDEAHQKLARKDKGKGRLGKSRSRHRNQHPDRECLVM